MKLTFFACSGWDVVSLVESVG